MKVIEFDAACSSLDRLAHGISIDRRTRRKAIRFDDQRLRVQLQPVLQDLIARLQHRERRIARFPDLLIRFRQLEKNSERTAHELRRLVTIACGYDGFQTGESSVVELYQGSANRNTTKAIPAMSILLRTPA